MCGICGIAYSETGRIVDELQLLAMRDAMTKRGPDDAGTYFAPGIGLGSRLQFLISPARAHANEHPPMGATGSSTMARYTTNANCDLRWNLAVTHFAHKLALRVILNLYADEVSAMLNRLNGIFAFVIGETRSERS